MNSMKKQSHRKQQMEQIFVAYIKCFNMYIEPSQILALILQTFSVTNTFYFLWNHSFSYLWFYRRQNLDYTLLSLSHFFLLLEIERRYEKNFPKLPIHLSCQDHQFSSSIQPWLNTYIKEKNNVFVYHYMHIQNTLSSRSVARRRTSSLRRSSTKASQR